MNASPAGDLDGIARQVIARYAVDAPSLQSLGNHGGFSGAWLWRVDSPRGPYCLRAWPAGDPSRERLRWIHLLMGAARLGGLECIPAVIQSDESATWLTFAGRLWELTSWMSGKADYRSHPSAARLASACTALAHVHQTWSTFRVPSGPCPAIERRLVRAREWCDAIASGWRLPTLDAADPVTPWATDAWSLLCRHVHRVPGLLASWASEPLSLQPCLCDVWHDHVLFTDDAVTGLIDFGSVKIDHPAVDLARLVGSLVGDDAQAWEVAMRAYRAVRPLSLREEALARVLDRSGVILALGSWLRWLYRDRKPFPDRVAVARRMAELVERITSKEWRMASGEAEA